ncbi:MAG: hypothetical protein IIB57_11170 [Planctomycetes bacterium]|nr:hypothetical protein [Planctomycetota bacterium]
MQPARSTRGVGDHSSTVSGRYPGSPGLSPTTPKDWGDAGGDFDGATWSPPNGVTNFGDVQAAIKTFQGGESAAPTIWVAIEPEEPNRIVNFNEVLQLVPAFTGQPYPFGDPANCP